MKTFEDEESSVSDSLSSKDNLSDATGLTEEDVELVDTGSSDEDSEGQVIILLI